MSKFNAGKASVLVLTAVFASVVGSMLLAGLGVFTQTASANSTPIEVVSSQLNYSGTGWGGWSCPKDYPFIVSASVTNSDGGAALYPTSLTLWKTGATVPGFTYPATPWGYTYGAGEEGAVVQNGGTAQNLKIHLICGLQAPTPTPTGSDFNLTSMCKPSENEGSLRIRNNSSEPQTYSLRLYGDDGDTYSGTVVVGDTLKTVPWNSSSDTWILQIAGYSFTKAIGNNASCESPTPTPTATPTTTTTSNGGSGVSDGLGCATHDCSGNANKVPQGQVLGASTMAKTGGFEDSLNLVIMALGGIFTFLGIKNFKKASK